MKLPIVMMLAQGIQSKVEIGCASSYDKIATENPLPGCSCPSSCSVCQGTMSDADKIAKAKAAIAAKKALDK